MMGLHTGCRLLGQSLTQTSLSAGDQITHQLELDEEIDREIRRDVFKEDPEYDEHEKQWQVGL